MKRDESSLQEFAQRQAAVLAGKGVASGEVDRRLRDVLGADAATAAATARYPLVDALLETPGGNADVRSRVLARVLARGETFAQVVRAAASVQLYAVAVAAIATVVWMIWLVYVAPQLILLYGQSRTALPQMTQAFANPLIGGAIMAIIWLVVLALWWSAQALRRVLRQLRPPSAILTRLPAVRDLVRTFIDFVTATIALELNPGSEPGRVIEQLQKWRAEAGLRPLATGGPGFNLGAALHAAARLNTLEAEAAWQAERLGLEFPIQAARAREWVMMLLLVVFGVIIGLMVISMYLPIFKLAAVL